MTTGPRVIVVGGGVIGVCCAYYLARGGAEVVLLERSRIGAGASSGNAGTVSAGHPPLNRPGRIRSALAQMLDATSPLYVRPRWDPELWRWMYGFARHCTAAHVTHCMRVMAPLGKDALGLFDSLLGEERIECGYKASGYFDVCATQAGLEAASHEADVISGYGYHPEVVDGDELRRREPAFGLAVLGGVFYPEAATLNPSVFLERLCVAVGKRGAEIREGAAVEEVLHVHGRTVGVRLTGGEVVSGDAVVLATGPFGAALARRVGVKLPLQPGKGYHRDIPIGPNGAPKLRVACVLNEASVFCTPMDTFVRFAGTMEFSGENSDMRRDRLQQLSRAGRVCFPDLGPARPVSEWCGLRPMSVDGLPIVGPLGDIEGLTVATGHGMLGLTLGPVTGEIITNHVLGRGDARLPALSPARFG
ncbi:MAG: FAD-dependent oxidoreductase [Gemmatimonadetes bacterium]|nr:FAD-dependent oxidoreductase [Gemmatimonadota bacterium]MDA1102051.1 FAD-dependent oxidoreductase [Gemmatimonadota bacterium]